MNAYDEAVKYLAKYPNEHDDRIFMSTFGKLKDVVDEITFLRCAVDGFEALSETHQAEIARLEEKLEKVVPALEVFAEPNNWVHEYDYMLEMNLIVWVLDRTYPDPAEFARKALDGKP